MSKINKNKYFLPLTGIAVVFILLAAGGFTLLHSLKKKTEAEPANINIKKIESAEALLFDKYAEIKNQITSSQRLALLIFKISGKLYPDSSDKFRINAKNTEENSFKTFYLPKLFIKQEKKIPVGTLADEITYTGNTFVEIWQKHQNAFIKIYDTNPKSKNEYLFLTEKQNPADKIIKGEEIEAENITANGIKIKKSFPVYQKDKLILFVTLESNINPLPEVSKIFNNDLIVFDKEGKLILSNKNSGNIFEEDIRLSENMYKNKIGTKKNEKGILFYKYIPEFSIYISFFSENKILYKNYNEIKKLVLIFIAIILILLTLLLFIFNSVKNKKYNKILSKIRKIIPAKEKIPEEKTIVTFFEYYSELKTLISEISKGNYNVKVCDNFKSGEIIKNLETIKNKFKETEYEKLKETTETEKKNRFEKASAEISEILQYSSDIKDLSEKIIQKIADFIKVEQIAIFVVNKDFSQNQKMEMTASYAFSKNRTANKILDVKEGLTGRAYLEKQSIFLTEIPDDYTFIESGFGFQKPNCILIVPLIFNNEVQAILELGSIKIIENDYIVFLENIGENIASTVANLKHSAQTQILLKQTKEQAEEIEIQRKTLEEKINTHRKQNRNLDKQILQLIEIIDSIKSVSYLVEYDLKGTVMDVSSKVTNAFGASKKDIISKSHKELVDTDNYNKKYKEFWDNLMNKKTVNIEETIQVAGKKITFKQTYVPIKNVRRKIYRILSIGVIKE